jgi:hypothetical protein
MYGRARRLGINYHRAGSAMIRYAVVGRSFAVYTLDDVSILDLLDGTIPPRRYNIIFLGA